MENDSFPCLSFPLLSFHRNKHTLNVDGNCLSFPVRGGYGEVLHNDACFYLSSFFVYIHGSSDILYVELYYVYQGILLAKDLNFIDLVCYYFLHCVNLIQVFSTILIQDIKQLITQQILMFVALFREKINVRILGKVNSFSSRLDAARTSFRE